MVNEVRIFKQTAAMLYQLGFAIIKEDLYRPWGGFYVINDHQAQKFAEYFFPKEHIIQTQRISPKILMVAPHKRLSWQYHYRRAEIWKCLSENVCVLTSNTDIEKNKYILNKGDVIHLKEGERHRLVGLENWGIIAEIWQHTDANNLSNEEDIVRLQDDFGRQ